MRKMILLSIWTSVLCLCMSFSGVSNFSDYNSDEFLSAQELDSVSPRVDTDSMQLVSTMVDKYVNMDVTAYESFRSHERIQPSVEHLLSGDEIFGLWISIRYDGQDFSKQVSLSPWVLRGKLSDPNYRTPITFNVDDDTADDIETGFGFFRYGIEEVTDGGTIDHPAWATAFDFMQINNGLSNQAAELEVWQEFHVNLGLIQSSSPHLFNKGLHQQQLLLQSNIGKYLRQRIQMILENIKALFPKLFATSSEDTSLQQFVNNLQQSIPTQASEDYIVLRVGYRSREGERIPMRVEKKFAVARNTIFRPAIFQHEMDSNDIIGTASNDFLFGFQAFQEGSSDPAYDIEFCVNFDPACYVVTQITPLSGKTFFYYHAASSEPTDITFSSNLLTGGSTAEEENATFSLTLSLDTIPNTVVGPGKWMSFDLNLLGDHSPLDGSFVYKASHKFNIGMTLNSPWFKEKIQVSGIPTRAEFYWGLDVSFDIVQGQLLYVDTVGFMGLTMNDDLDEIAVFYPTVDPMVPDVVWASIQAIPSSRRIEAGASFAITNNSMLTISAQGYVEHDMSSSLGAIQVFYPKPDPVNDSDILFFKIPSGSFADYGRISVEGTLYVDSDPDNFWVNPSNYFYGRVDRVASADFGEASMYLPGVDIPLIKVYDVPGDASGMGQFWWNQLRGHVRAQRSSSSGNQDPIRLSLVFDDLVISDELRIGNGYIDMQGKIAEEGYFIFDATNDMLDNCFSIQNLATDQSLLIEAGTISASEFQAYWDLNVSGENMSVESLDVMGQMSAFRNFYISIGFSGDTVAFTGDWSLGDSGSIELDFTQDDPIYLDFDLDGYVENIDFHGYVILNNELHFDASWDWRQGSYTDPAFFKINQNSNTPNLQAINLYFTYNDNWGANVTLTGMGLYVCVEWYWHNLQLFIWPVISISGSLDLHLLLDSVWYYNVEENWP